MRHGAVLTAIALGPQGRTGSQRCRKLWLSVRSAASPDLGSVSLPAHSAAREIALRLLPTRQKTARQRRLWLLSKSAGLTPRTAPPNPRTQCRSRIRQNYPLLKTNIHQNKRRQDDKTNKNGNANGAGDMSRSMTRHVTSEVLAHAERVRSICGAISRTVRCRQPKQTKTGGRRDK